MNNKLGTCLFDIAPVITGKVTYRDFLENNFGLGLILINNGDFSPGKLISIESNEYFLEIGISQNGYYIRRNNYELILEFHQNQGTETQVTFFYDKTTMLIHTEELNKDTKEIRDKRIKKITTSAISVPNLLKEKILEMNLTREKIYENENVFLFTVIQIFQHLQDKIDYLNLYESFWNTHTKGARIIDRKPKSEVELHSIIHSLIYDIAKIKNIDIYPEYPIGGGILDFLFCGTLINGEKANVCVEFKLAHSQDLDNGLVSQLPIYMRNKSTDLGIYVILYFKGEWFSEPIIYDSVFDMKVHTDRLKVRNGLNNIRVQVLDLSKKQFPSKVKN